jgi:hypothetical protein
LGHTIVTVTVSAMDSGGGTVAGAEISIPTACPGLHTDLDTARFRPMRPAGSEKRDGFVSFEISSNFLFWFR